MIKGRLLRFVSNNHAHSFLDAGHAIFTAFVFRILYWVVGTRFAAFEKKNDKQSVNDGAGKAVLLLYCRNTAERVDVITRLVSRRIKKVKERF